MKVPVCHVGARVIGSRRLLSIVFLVYSAGVTYFPVNNIPLLFLIDIHTSV